MNKKLLKISVLALGAFFSAKGSSCDETLDCCSGDIAGTFLAIRPNGQYSMPEMLSFWRRRASTGPCGEGRECGVGGAIQIVGFGGQTTQGKRLGRYFMFGNTNALTVGSDQTDSEAIRQVNPVNFGIDFAAGGNTYSSIITFSPRQSFAGVGFEWRQYFGWWNCDCDSRWWFDVSFPFEHVRNKVNLIEVDRVVTGTVAFATGAATTMVEALAGLANFENVTGAGRGNDTRMEFGLVPTTTSSQSRNGVADVTVRIGYDALCTECCYVNGYLGVLAPTGNRPKGRYIFEPIVGHNRHVGIVWGSLMSYNIWDECDRSLSWEVNFDSLYLFKGKETRSFDLRGHGPWSRYLLVYADADDAASRTVSPGINYFTRELNVTPRFWATINSALVYSSACGFTGELGWNFWAKQAEKVSLRDPFPTGVRLAALNLDNNQFNPALSNLLNTIGNNNATGLCDGDLLPNSFLNDVALTVADLDLCSAANKAAITNIFYGALGWNVDWCCVPMFLGVGGSYEFTPINTAVSRWTVWGKWGVSF